jgi:hypothetical protein
MTFLPTAPAEVIKWGPIIKQNGHQLAIRKIKIGKQYYTTLWTSRNNVTVTVRVESAPYTRPHIKNVELEISYFKKIDTKY